MECKQGHVTHLKITAWGLEKRMVRIQAMTTISLALRLCAAQLRDSRGDWMVISLSREDFNFPISFLACPKCC